VLVLNREESAVNKLAQSGSLGIATVMTLMIARHTAG
jgi:hypothetical protein